MAEVKILIRGWTNAEAVEAGEQENDACTTTLIKDGDIVAVVDPGIMNDKQVFINALSKAGMTLEDVTHIFITHSHIDHYRNVGMFAPLVPVVEYWGIWSGSKVTDWSGKFSKNIEIVKTPGHSYDGLTFLVNTDRGKVGVVGDVFWKENEPKDDPYAINMEQLIQTRQEVLKMSDFIIPGHGDLYEVKK